MSVMIIDLLKVKENNADAEYVKELEECGFPRISNEFPIITLEAIIEFLLELSKIKATKNGLSETDSLKDVDIVGDNIEVDSRHHIKPRIKTTFWGREYVEDYCNRLFASVWKEVPLEEFKATPPKHILESIKLNKDKFDYLRIVTVKTVVDPLIVGRFKNNSDRYLIDYWDKDIDVSKIKISGRK